MSTLTPEAKQLLSSTIRALRARLLQDLKVQADRCYRLSLPAAEAGLDEAHAMRRSRLDAWLDERVRATKPRKAEAAARERLLAQCVKEAGATLLNRIVLVRHLEAMSLSIPAVVTGGWNSRGYREFREFCPALTADDTEGYATLLQFLFDELAVDLPGLFGDVGLTSLFPIPAATLREVIEQLDDERLQSAWNDDTTLGWVYQYWNDPEREALDAKIAGGGKIEPHEIASKTQMFTERYMVEWLLHNSLGLAWLCICKKNGWTPDAERVLTVLDDRRAEWRTKREAGEVALDALMPIETELEDAWKYYVPQPIPEDAVSTAPDSIRSLKLLDPACGSGHFLVIAFDLLVRMHREEARHRGEAWSDEDIAETILANNLHGVDIDPRAIQIAAAGLHLKAKAIAPRMRASRVNLVAPALQLGDLPDEDPSVVQLRTELKREAGISEELTKKLVAGLAGVDHLGTLLKVDSAIEEALRTADLELQRTSPGQGDLFKGFSMQQVKLSLGEAKATVLDRLEAFLTRHSSSEDLGLRLDGEQLAAGVRFVRLVQEGQYDVVVGNPPYQGLSKTSLSDYVARKYPRGKADLYAAFLERGIELAREGGLSALLTMRGWMFLGTFAELRMHLLGTFDLRLLGDVDRGAFEDVPDEVLATVMSIVRRSPPALVPALAMQPTPLDDRTRDSKRTGRKRAAVLAQVGRYEFDPKGFEVIEGEPIVYWWSREFLQRYAEAPKLGATSPAKAGAVSGNHVRFLRLGWEIPHAACANVPNGCDVMLSGTGWVRYVKGARGMSWIDPCDEVCNWARNGLAIKTNAERLYGRYTRQIRNEQLYFAPGIAVAGIGAAFSARIYRWRAVFDNMAASVFPDHTASTLCSMNTTLSRTIVQSLNPGIHFEISDVNRLPVFVVEGADTTMASLSEAFRTHESHREPSVEFKSPGPSPWRHAQDWAQLAVDRPDGAPLPPYQAEYDDPPPENYVSFAVGVALGRFGAQGEGILEDDPASALPNGILFVSATGEHGSLQHPACAGIHDAWANHRVETTAGDLGEYLRKGFFLGVHKPMYENRPIYFPLSSSKKNFVAWVSIHRWGNDTLNVVLADHLKPEQRRLEGERDDLRQACADKASKGRAERRFAEVQKLLEELGVFIDTVTKCADHGPPPPDSSIPKRECDARYSMDLDDGVMVNSAALWPLLEPQWKDPKKWWKELATAKGRKDYDWSHLAARYFPTRVEGKCKEDPSLGVAHTCFWRLHPAKAFAWELRLQDEIRPDFTIDEPGSEEFRTRFVAERAQQAMELQAAERRRRERKAQKGAQEESDGPLYEQGAEGGNDEQCESEA